MGFYIQDDLWEALEDHSDKVQNETLGALVRLYFTKTEATSLKGIQKTVYVSWRERTAISRTKSDAKKRPSDDSNYTSNGTSNTDQTDNQNSNQNDITSGDDLLKSESKKNLKPKEPPLPPLDSSEDEFVLFGAEALSIFNAETGKDVREMSSSTWFGLRRIFDSGRSLEDVRKVVKEKNSQWVNDSKMTKFIRPSTLFGEKFDEYTNESQGGVSDEEFEDLSCGF